jgi:hypothetical protein
LFFGHADLRRSRANSLTNSHPKHHGGRDSVREGANFMRSRFPSTTQFPFRRDNGRRDGFWDAPDVTDDNIKGSSIDPYDPVWPRWTKTPPLDGEGEFVSSEPFFDIDEITQKATLYPAGTPLVDRNLDGNPGSRQRVVDTLAGNLWRRRLLVPYEGDATDVVTPLAFAQATPAAPGLDQEVMPGAESTQFDVMQSIKPEDITGRMTGRILGRRYGLGVPSKIGGVFIQQVDDLNGTMYLRGQGERNMRGPTPYTEILGAVAPGGTATGKPYDDEYKRDPRDTKTIRGDINGRGRIFFLEGVTIQQLQNEGFDESARNKLPTGGKLSRPGRYEVPAGTPAISLPFNIKW